MIQRTTENDLVVQAVGLAARTRRRIESAGLQPTDFDRVAALFGVSVSRVELSEGVDGSYLRDQRRLILNTRRAGPERVNFTFCHELMHACIEDDDELLSAFADADLRSDEATMERLCNAGAAEILIPAEDVRQVGCSVAHIPELCERFSASSIAVALQMIHCAAGQSYLVIAEPRQSDAATEMFGEMSTDGERLHIAFAAESATANYRIRRGRPLQRSHGLYDALQQPGVPLKMEAEVPIGKNPWRLPCECLYFRQKVFAVFHESVRPAVSPDQMRML